MGGGKLTYLQNSKVWNIIEVYKLKIPWIIDINVKSLIGRCNGWSSLTKYSHNSQLLPSNVARSRTGLCKMCGRY